MIAPNTAVIPLETLSRGEAACIFDVSGEAATVHRLAEMGLCHGARITVKEPGSPMRVTVEGRDLLLRCGGAVCILVSPGVSSRQAS